MTSIHDISTNTSSIEFQRKNRIEKIKNMRAIGIEPYPVTSQRDYILAEVARDFDTLQTQSKIITLAGRIKTKRGSGKIMFLVLEDYSYPEGFQVVIKIDDMPVEQNYDELGFTYQQCKSFVDEGDYVQVSGSLQLSQSGHPSLFAKDVRMLTKCLRPLPDQMDAENTEERYLNRVADIKMNVKGDDNVSVKDYIIAREKYWRIWREEMLNEGFVETYNNMFETKPAGADAKPFTTFYNELESDVYLRLALEIPLKKLIAGGFEKVFEIGRIFRNEGSSPTHLQDYTQIEWYWAYSDYYDAMPFTVRIYRRIAQEILGTLEQITYKGEKINWGKWFDKEANSEGWRVYDGWPAIPYFDAIRYFSKHYYSKGEVDLENRSYEELLVIATEHDVDITQGINISNLIDKIYNKVARPFMTHPMFLTEQPVFLEPLAKRSPENKELVHRWQIIAGGAELGKCFSELNDPLDQFERLEEQQKAKDAGDEEAQFLDEEFVKAMEYGMPPMSGFGMSERLISFLLGKHIREVTNFPYIKEEKINNAKDTKTYVQDVVLLKSPTIPMWSMFNTATHLSCALGFRNSPELQGAQSVKTKDGEEVLLSSPYPINIKSVDDESVLRELLQQAKQNGLIYSEFTSIMRDSKNQAQDIEVTKNTHSKDVEYLGVAIFGERKEVQKITGDVPRFTFD